MTSMSPTMNVLRDIDPREVSDLILNDERWDYAQKEFGLKEVNYRVNPLDPTKGRIYTRWSDPGAAVDFMTNFIGAFKFFKKGEVVAEPAESPEIEISPLRMAKARSVKPE